MKQIIAPCGIVCNECPAFIGTQTDDWDLLQKTAESWSDEKHRLEAKDLICDGCSEERLHSFCRDCEVRACTKEKGHQVCSQCQIYPCDRLNNLWSSFTTYSPEEARKTLELALSQL